MKYTIKRLEKLEEYDLLPLERYFCSMLITLEEYELETGERLTLDKFLSMKRKKC